MTDISETFPPRLHAVLARSKSVGVIFRRGPSKQVATFLWDRDKDTFHIGQWLKGRIYERRADISPDGKHLIYFAQKGKGDSETFAWTAVSKAPFLKAVDLHKKRDCWEGGGLFIDNHQYWLNDQHFLKCNTSLKNSSLKYDRKAGPEQHFGSECTGVYYPRLLKNGWEITQRSEVTRWNRLTEFEKKLANGWLLRKIAHEQLGSPQGKGCYWDEHEVENVETGFKIQCPEWEWAEEDQKTIVWAEFGKLYRVHLNAGDKLPEPVLLHDFTDYKFERIKAPY